jgi:hypothetical protein
MKRSNASSQVTEKAAQAAQAAKSAAKAAKAAPAGDAVEAVQVAGAVEAAHAVALLDQRPFFEKALLFGMAHGILDAAKLDAMQAEAPKGIVQIARYFGTEYLRPDLEKAKDRMVNLISLHLEHDCAGDLRSAAQLLREHSLLSRSKAGADMLKAMLVMPQNSHFGMHTPGGFAQEHIVQLAQWSLRSLADYQAQWSQRNEVAQRMQAAFWMAQALELDADSLQDASCDAEALIRTGLLAMAMRLRQIPDWPGFQSMVLALRQHRNAAESVRNAIPKNLPAELRGLVQTLQDSVLSDLPKILDSSVAPRKLFDQTPAFIGRYYWQEDLLSEVDHFEREMSPAWRKATQGHTDDSSILTLLLCIAAGSPPKTLLTLPNARSLVRKIRKSGLKAELARDFLQNNAPASYCDGYVALWNAFFQSAAPVLQSDADYQLVDALAALQRDCNIAAST